AFLTRVARRRSFWLEKSVRTAIAVPMANDPPFATLNHVAGDLGIPSESALLRIGISCEGSAVSYGFRARRFAATRNDRLALQKLIARLATASAASLTASLKVGWAWQVRAMSSAE